MYVSCISPVDSLLPVGTGGRATGRHAQQVIPATSISTAGTCLKLVSTVTLISYLKLHHSKYELSVFNAVVLTAHFRSDL